MAAFNENKIMSLIEKAHQYGIKFSYNENGLTLKLLKGKQVDPFFLEELQKNKNVILEYLKEFKKADTPHFQATAIEHEGYNYYDVTPTQIYWVDNNIDREFKIADSLHGSLIHAYKVSGEFDLSIFKQSVCCLVNRHESLRATFHAVNNRFMMRVEDGCGTSYQVDHKDVRTKNYDNKDIENLIYFRDHTFCLRTGPLFMVRVVQTASDEYFIAFKIHHVVFDSWSLEILLRDLLIVYKNLMQGKESYGNRLAYQFRDFLAFTNWHSAQTYERDKRYWNNLFPQLPPKLRIPGAEVKASHNIANKICCKTKFFISDKYAGQLRLLAKKLSTGLFIVLQASIKAWLFKITGQNDLLIGTYVAGRDIPGTEEQIGSYARTALLRTVLHEADSFYDIIKKVKKVNEDMSTYKAFTLLDLTNEMIIPGLHHNDYWKVNIQYADANGFSVARPDLDNLPQKFDFDLQLLPAPATTVIPIDFQIFFFNTDRLIMEAQYDSSTYSPDAISGLMNGYLSFLEKIVSNPGALPCNV